MIAAGARARRRVVVDDARAITFMGPALRVYGTPNMLHDVEMACRDLLLEVVASGQDSVGVEVHLAHRGAAVLGAEVEIDVAISSAEGRLVSFEATVRSGGEAIGTAQHLRSVVEVARLEARVRDLQADLATVQSSGS
ncbi:thioesterase family protein [Xanthobacter tagetidis]|uniref:LysR family transcriptional regulator n=1 Tax=Xanthobacter tagetidis TaxID=60216 RepID=A0A3L7A1H3_9HYPH|nr:LysR family transcriptional regulator [Xanthobacter tagetidis]MBB6307155.1 putative thioesterase [Xanthobacter tagetidis]RLP73997.1 LysR family transcriptional regulator [Xanthobacter tagetidis]